MYIVNVNVNFCIPGTNKSCSCDMEFVPCEYFKQIFNNKSNKSDMNCFCIARD